jgi:hypothetical protein
MKKTSILVIAVLFLISLKANSSVSTGKDTLTILFIGNSYTYVENLPQIVSMISDSARTKLVTKKSTIGGAKLSEHWRGARGLKSKEMITNGHFDIVVLQEFSLGAISEPDSALRYLDLFCGHIRKSGAKPYLYLTWAREKVPQYQEAINRIYSEAAVKNNAVIVPVGKAWALARQWRPTIGLYDADGSHPSQLGTFLTACVFVAAILNEIPGELMNEYVTKDMEGESVVLMNLDPLDVIFCRKIAEEVIRMK